MSVFNEHNTVRDYIRDFLNKNSDWTYIKNSELNYSSNGILLEEDLVNALIRLNPSIKEKPDRADEVIYKLRAIFLSVHSEGLVKANETFTRWLKSEYSMPFGKNNQHVTIHLIDYVNPHNNDFITTTEYTYKSSRFDNVLFVNGIPMIVGETKTATRPAITWVDAASDIFDYYEKEHPEFFVPNLFSFATEGREFRYASIRTPLQLWAPWQADKNNLVSLQNVEKSLLEMTSPKTLVDILLHFQLYATDKWNRKIKITCRHQQYEGANLIVDRVLEGITKKGLIWHFQGSGKSFLMVFAAQKLRQHPILKSPTVIIVLDRIDLDTQITATFNAADIPNLQPAKDRKQLMQLLKQDIRKIIITTIYKFAEADDVLNERENIIVMVDEAHRTQEGDLGIAMKKSLPNAFFFGLTGTPINKLKKNTFVTFGSEVDENGYLSRYSFEDSIRDNATLPLHFEPRLVEMHVNEEGINKEVSQLTDGMQESDLAILSKKAGTLANFVRSKERIENVTQDIVSHFKSKVEPNGFKAMVVCYDRQSCVEYKEAFDKIIPWDTTHIVMSHSPKKDPKEWKKKYNLSKDMEEKLLDRFRDPDDPFKILIVTSKLLTGFDAPILQTMYVDKVLKDHTLLQAICRANRPYPKKIHGLIVDYIGIFDNVAQTLTFDAENIRQSIKNIRELQNRLPGAIVKCLSYFEGLDRTIEGYEGLIGAQEMLPSNVVRDSFGADFSYLTKLWEAISPDPILYDYISDYKWLSGVYESIQPVTGHGKLIWHALGAKTLEIIDRNIEFEKIRDDLETVVIDEEVISDLEKQPDKNSKVVELKISRRLRKHKNDPKFIELGERLEQVKERYEKGFLNSVEYLKALLSLAKQVLEAERVVDPIDDRKQAKTALTDLFNETKTEKTPKMVERIVNDIDEVVRTVRFEGWQWTKAGEREVKQALRRTLLKYKLHKNQELFEKAYAYIREYY
ncbi:MAG: Type-1 restriction enzyme R protein [Candidatus Heimdallarchaeota archaeon LC_2]|nr:MAG: Type-1 restriction enzyme R protein [Candidatus Heimdallarchaeota archaeon LC_2]